MTHLGNEIGGDHTILLECRCLVPNSPRVHPIVSPSMQCSRHDKKGRSTYTLSPTATDVTPSPSWTTTPAASQPKIAGYGGEKRPVSCMIQSMGLSATESARTSTSSRPGLSTSMVPTANCARCPGSSSAFCVIGMVDDMFLIKAVVGWVIVGCAHRDLSI